MRSVVLAGIFVSAACSACSHPPAAAAARAAPRSVGASVAPPTSVDPLPGPLVPVPETLALIAGQFGLTMQAEGFRWKVLRRNVTRFDWSGRPAAGDRELLYSFVIEQLDEASAERLPQIASSTAANLTEGDPCKPLEQPADMVQKLGVDRIVTVCFEPSPFYGGKEHRHGVLHAIVHDRALTIAVVLSNESTAIPPLPKVIGARGAPRSR